MAVVREWPVARASYYPRYRSRYGYPPRWKGRRDPTSGLSGRSGAQTYVSRMRRPDKKQFAQALLDARLNGTDEPPSTGQLFELEVRLNLDKLLDWPANRCTSCSKRLRVCTAPFKDETRVPLCDPCDRRVPCVDCGKPRGNRRAVRRTSGQGPRRGEVDPRRQCAECAAAEAAGLTPLTVLRARRRQRLRKAATTLRNRAMGVAVIVGLASLYVLFTSTSDPQVDQHRATRTPDIASSIGDSGSSSRLSGAAPYIGGGSSGFGSGGTVGGSSPGYGPGLSPSFICSDGSVSYAQHSQGACSHHGGIAGRVDTSIPPHSQSTGSSWPLPGLPKLPKSPECESIVEVCLEATPDPSNPTSTSAADLEEIRGLLGRYYTAMNAADYSTAYGFLSMRRQSDSPLAEWAARQQGISFADVRLLDAAGTPSGFTITLAYLTRSTRNPDQECTAWKLRRDVVGEGSQLRLEANTVLERRACEPDESGASQLPLYAGSAGR